VDLSQFPDTQARLSRTVSKPTLTPLLRNLLLSITLRIHSNVFVQCCVTMEMQQTHCYATGTVTLLWKWHKLVVMQQALSRYYGNATGCTDHVTKENLICHNTFIPAPHGT